ncbi:MAG: nucleotidyltransferase family protein [Synergistaceae bacterium]|nr:nucleotidyltransferase family protein [Synergistaceae bacterium]
MRTAGIIAEYNPFHKGHEYHIRKSREFARIDAIIAVISANFTQRGEPALLDKFSRAKMALCCGADLVLELPAVFSCGSAGIFADAAVDILASAGVAEYMAFGMESPEKKSEMEAMADLLSEEPPSFREPLKKFLRLGYSFVQSRSLALEETFPGALDILKRPNNNLALSYIKRIRFKKYPMETIAVARSGGGFHDTSPGGGFASAAAVRELVFRGDLAGARHLMPEKCADILEEALSLGHAAASGARLWTAVKQTLLRMTPGQISEAAEIGEGLENRMRRCVYEARDYDSFVGMCVSRRYTKGRIQRCCAHLILGLDRGAGRRFRQGGPQYIRVLGANGAGREVLALMRKSAALPVISRSGGRLSRLGWEMMNFEHSSTEIWETLTDSPRAKAEARAVPVLKDF